MPDGVAGVDCPRCAANGKRVFLRLSHPQWGGPGKKVNRGECDECSHTCTVIQFVVGEVTKTGTGAHAVAKKLRTGVARVSMEEPEAD